MFWIIDEEGREYGKYDTYEKAEKALDGLLFYTPKDVYLTIEEEE